MEEEEIEARKYKINTGDYGVAKLDSLKKPKISDLWKPTKK